MAKKSEINKKGRLAKSTLSVVLAASMVLTSSSFVWASPVESGDIAIISEDGAEQVGVKVDNTAPALAGAVITLEDGETPAYIYSGEATQPKVKSVTVGDDIYTYDELADYNMEVAYPTDCTAVGEYEVTVQEIGNDSNKTTAEYSVVKNDEDLKLTTSTASVKIGEDLPELGTFSLSTDMIDDIAIKSVEFEGNTKKPGIVKATATIADGIAGNFETITATCNITVTDDAETEADVTGLANLVYTGQELEPAIDVKIKGQQLVLGDDYTVTYKYNKNAYEKSDNNGKFTSTAPQVTINFTNAYTGRNPQTIQFEIEKYDFDEKIVGRDYVLSYDQDQTFTYSGKEQLPAVKGVTAALIAGMGKTALAASDYEVKASGNCVDASNTAAANVVGKGNFKGTIGRIGFKIEKKVFSSSTVSVKAKPSIYDGNVIRPEFVVTDIESNKVLDDSEYDVFYANEAGTGYVSTPYGKNYGTYDAQIRVSEFSGNYKAGSAINTTYTISGKTLDNAIVNWMDYEGENGVDITSEPDPITGIHGFTYDGSKKGQAPTYISLNIGSENIICTTQKDINSSASVIAEFPDAKDCVNVGTYDIKLTGKNDYAGQTAIIKFAITPVEIPKTTSGNFTVNPAFAATTHTGDAAKPFVDLVYNGYQLVEGTDFTTTVNETAKTVTVTGKGNFVTTKPVTYNYTASNSVNLNDPSIQATIGKTYEYTSSAVTLADGDLVVKEVGTASTYALVVNRDYKIKGYENNTEAGTAYVIIEGINNANGGFTGTRKVAFEIVGKDVATAYKLDTTNLKAEVTYTGSPIKVGYNDGIVVRKISNNAVVSPSEIEKITYLRNGVETKDFTSTGTITMQIKVKNYSGMLEASYTIVGKQLTDDAKINDKITDQKYTGEEIKPAVEVTAKSASNIIKEGTDYTVTYKNNINVGEAYAVVTGIGRYTGSYLISFKITGEDISAATATAEAVAYNGKAQTPAVAVKLGDKTLTADTDYTVEYKDNINAGTASFTVTGKGGYAGSVAGTFTINKADQKLAVSKTTADALKGRNTNANSYTLKVTGAGTALTYKSSNTKIASVSTAGKISFKHVCGKATITVTAAADDNHNAATLKVAVAVKPATAKITVTARTKGFNVKATAVKDITGYQVGYSTDKNFAASKTTKKLVKTTKALNKNYSGLSAKKGYYVRVRAYKTASDGTVTWGNWTSAKRITTK